MLHFLRGQSNLLHIHGDNHGITCNNSGSGIDSLPPSDGGDGGDGNDGGWGKGRGRICSHSPSWNVQTAHVLNINTRPAQPPLALPAVTVTGIVIVHTQVAPRW